MKNTANIKSRSIPLKQALWQTPALILVAGMIALGVNQWRSDGIELIGDWSVEERFVDAAGDRMIISLDQARLLFQREAALFVDARPESQYADGHIQGALTIPWQEVDRYFMKMADRLDDASMIITYCDGESCDLSHHLALFLKDMGFANVRVLVNGLTVWKEAGLPTEIGEMTP